LECDATEFDSSVRNSHLNHYMSLKTQATVNRATDTDLQVGLICADRDGNRIRIDRLDRDSKTLSYHFLNDELRVQEGIQDRTVDQFVAEGWYVAAPGKSL
jgi:hypothetical protein